MHGDPSVQRVHELLDLGGMEEDELEEDELVAPGEKTSQRAAPLR